MEITQITIYKENGTLIARVFEEDGEIKMIVRDGVEVDIQSDTEGIVISDRRSFEK